MAWSNTFLSLYHGTVGPHADAIARRIDLGACNPKRDFGRGFYTTRIRDQAVKFAIYKYGEALFDYHKKGAFDPESAAVVELQIDLGALSSLDTLAFVQPTPDWRSFIRYCRRTGGSHKLNNNYYQVIYGPVGSSRGALTNYEQISFHDDYSVSILNIVRIDKWVPPP